LRDERKPIRARLTPPVGSGKSQDNESGGENHSEEGDAAGPGKVANLISLRVHLPLGAEEKNDAKTEENRGGDPNNL
jgi:hypothetical protein